jgi:two-component system sensor histidine kinase/response regulator
MSLRTKIFIPLLLSSILLVSYISGIWMPHLLKDEENANLMSLSRHLDSVDEGLVPLLLGKQLDAVYGNLDALLKENDDWISLELFDAQGKALYPLVAPVVPKGREAHEIRQLQQDIHYHDTQLGNLVLKVDFTPRLNEMKRQHVIPIALFVIVMLLFLLTTGLILERLVNRPIKHLVMVSQKLSEGDFDIPLRKTSSDEIGNLEASFLEMRNAIRVSTTNLSTMLEKNADGILIVALDGDVLYVNPAAQKLLGKRKEDILGQPFGFPVFEDKTEDILIIRKNAEPCEAEFRAVRLEWQKRPAFQLSVRDITERKRAETQLHESRNLLRSVVENTPIRVFWKDAELRYLGCNIAFARDAGMTRPEDVIGKDDFQMAWREQAELYRADDKLVMDSDTQKLAYEEPQTTSDGHTIWLRTSKVPLRDTAGKVFGILGVYEDITERKQADELLRKSEEAFRLLFESSRDAIVIFDRKGFTDSNKAALEMFGYSSKEAFLTKHPDDLFPALQPDGRDSKTTAAKYIEAAYTTGMQLFEWKHKRTDGTEFDTEVILSRLELHGNVVLQAVVRDITERKQFQMAEIERITAENIYRSKSEFLANMSHELRTPLNSVLGFSELLRDNVIGKLTDQQKEAVENIHGSGQHLLNLISDILDFSRIEAGKLKLEIDQIMPEQLISGSLVLFREKAMKHGLKLEFQGEPGSHVILEADESKLKQIMYNLLSNAVKFTPDGGSVSVAVRRVQSSEYKFKGLKEDDSELRNQHSDLDGDFMEISVADTGIGIRPEDINKLFNPFSQLESAYTKKYEGTGLGLALTKQLVELHGGRIWVESEIGKGSKFTFVIPIKQGKNADAGDNTRS